MNRKVAAVVMLIGMVMLLIVASSAAAFAQKDPFNPLVRPEGSGTQGSTTGGTAPPAPATQPSGPSLSNTGVEVADYVVLSLIFIGAGVAFLGLDRYRRLA